MKTNAAGIALIKAFEGFRSKAYRDSVGVWTIGYGHTSAAGQPEVKRGLIITESEGEAILARDLLRYERGVSAAIKRPMTPNQFAAMVSLCYNIGEGNFSRSSLVRYFNAGQADKASRAFLAFNKAGGKVLPGLVRRRAAESALFDLKDKVEPAPTAAPQPAPQPEQPAAPSQAGKGAAGTASAVVATGGALAASGFGARWILAGMVIAMVAGIIIFIIKQRNNPNG